MNIQVPAPPVFGNSTPFTFPTTANPNLSRLYSSVRDVPFTAVTVPFPASSFLTTNDIVFAPSVSPTTLIVYLACPVNLSLSVVGLPSLSNPSITTLSTFSDFTYR